jgi:hypothetical protein
LDTYRVSIVDSLHLELLAWCTNGTNRVKWALCCLCAPCQQGVNIEENQTLRDSVDFHSRVASSQYVLLDYYGTTAAVLAVVVVAVDIILTQAAQGASILSMNCNVPNIGSMAKHDTS